MPIRDYNSIPISRELLTRLFSHITVQDTGYKTECWLWYTHNHAKYATMCIGGIPWLIHRLNYALFVGFVDPDLDCDHLCRVPTCVNPEHIEPVTQTENIRRGLAYNGNYCKRGHLMDSVNEVWTAATARRTARRYCRQCRNDWMRERKRKHRAENPLTPKTHCKHGHEFTEANTYTFSNGYRYCRTCKLLRQRRDNNCKSPKGTPYYH